MTEAKYLICDSPESHPQLTPDDFETFPPKLICSTYDEDWEFIDGEFNVQNMDLGDDVLESVKVTNDPEAPASQQFVIEDGVECRLEDNRLRGSGGDLVCEKTR